MVTYLIWWYNDEPVLLWQAVKVITKKIYHNFSVTLLLRTLFDPWKRDTVSAENASLDVQFRLLLSNLVSRFVGFIVRFFTIIIGLFFTAISFFVMLAGLCLWILMPVVILILFIHGLTLMING